MYDIGTTFITQEKNGPLIKGHIDKIQLMPHNLHGKCGYTAIFCMLGKDKFTTLIHKHGKKRPFQYAKIVLLEKLSLKYKVT